MTWNFRILGTTFADGSERFAVHEVFYDYDGDIPNSWTAEPIDFGGDTVDEVRQALAQALNDCTRQTPLRIAGSKLVEVTDETR